MDGSLEVSVESRDGVPIVRARGEVDIASAPTLADALAGVSGERVIVDLSDVSFVDSSGLGVLIAARSGEEGERRIEIVATHPQVVKVFRVTNLDSIFPIYDRVDEALGQS